MSISRWSLVPWRPSFAAREQAIDFGRAQEVLATFMRVSGWSGANLTLIISPFGQSLSPAEKPL